MLNMAMIRSWLTTKQTFMKPYNIDFHNIFSTGLLSEILRFFHQILPPQVQTVFTSPLECEISVLFKSNWIAIHFYSFSNGIFIALTKFTPYTLSIGLLCSERLMVEQMTNQLDALLATWLKWLIKLVEWLTN